MIVTNEDRILCSECYREMYIMHDPSTHRFKNIKHGKCSVCGKEEKKK